MREYNVSESLKTQYINRLHKAYLASIHDGIKDSPIHYVGSGVMGSTIWSGWHLVYLVIATLGRSIADGRRGGFASGHVVWDPLYVWILAGMASFPSIHLRMSVLACYRRVTGGFSPSAFALGRRAASNSTASEVVQYFSRCRNLKVSQSICIRNIIGRYLSSRTFNLLHCWTSVGPAQRGFFVDWRGNCCSVCQLIWPSPNYLISLAVTQLMNTVRSDFSSIFKKPLITLYQ